MAVKVGSARIDENGKAHGGKAGDQNGKEVKISNWYSYGKSGWDVVIRPKDRNKAHKMAEALIRVSQPYHALSFFSEPHLIFKIILEIFDLDTHLLHRITLAHSHSAVFLRVEIVSHAERCADLVLTAVALADIAAVIVIAVMIFCEFTVDLLCRLGKFL